MIATKECFPEMISSPVRKIGARVELYNGSTLLQIFQYTDALKSFNIERVGEGKFFGFGICHRLNVKLIDKDRQINITTANTIEIEFGVECDFMYPYPLFYVSEVHRDENTNELSITAYDALYAAAAHTVSELELANSYSILEFTVACATFLGLPLRLVNVNDNSFDTIYGEGANFDGTETIREALDAIAEATQTIYYINNEWALTFKRLDIDGAAVLPITKDCYISLSSKTNRRLTTITHATELGDNVSASTTESGSTQYVRDNPFWDLRDDIGTLVDNALAAIGGLTINQFECEWRGNFAAEIGDKIELTTKDNQSVISYLLNDTISYDGFLSEKTEWKYEDNEEETADNPSTLGEALKQTYARVDKANKQIDLVASETAANTESISALQINTESISASVQKVETALGETVEGINDSISTLTQKVEATMSAEDVNIAIKSELANGVDKVVTETGFKFDAEGLTVSKTGSEMTTTITEDGMKVYRDKTAVLTANNNGVDAVNLHATTYLIVGNNSRFEDFGSNRTGCFWIGG